MRTQLQSILDVLPRFGSSSERLPIIDMLETEGDDIVENGEEELGASGRSSAVGGREHADSALRERSALRQPHAGIPGIRLFRDNIRNDIEQIDKVRICICLSPVSSRVNDATLLLVVSCAPRAAQDHSYPVSFLYKCAVSDRDLERARQRQASDCGR